MRPLRAVRGPARRRRRLVLVAVAVLSLAACAAPRAEVQPVDRAAVDLSAGAALPERVPAGVVRVAVPDGPASFLDLRGDDPVAADLAALWGLPLFRYDPAGQLVPALVEDWEIVADAGGWGVELHLRPGRWSDGSAVTAGDVVATLAALRDGPRAAELAPLVEVGSVDEHRVRLRFDRPYARWWALLDGVGVLPAAVLARDGLAAFDAGIPVAGGSFVLDEHVPGLRTSFTAHTDGPLGAPVLERVEVLIVPRYEAALGMLRRGDADVVLGYLALNGVDRAGRLDGVEAAAPVGGTTVALSWRPDGRMGGADALDRRRAVAAAIDVSQLVEGLLGPAGEPAASVVPGVDGPASRVAPGAGVEVGQPTVVLPRWAEAIAFTGRALQRDLRSAGGGLELIAEPVPEFVLAARASGDARLSALRTGPAPSFVGTTTDRELALAGDAAGPGSVPFADAVTRSRADALVLPLYRIGVLHAWSSEVQRIRPSSWPGLAFWDAAAWTLGSSAPP